MKKTWFPQLIAAFVLAAVAGLYLVPQTLSAEEMSQIVGACACDHNHEAACQSYTTSDNCREYRFLYAVSNLQGGGDYTKTVPRKVCYFIETNPNLECIAFFAPKCGSPDYRPDSW